MPAIFKRCFYISLIFSVSISASYGQCDNSDFAIQVLGSGGPIADDARASSGYLIWIDGKARILIDAGGGIFIRFAESKAKFDELDAIILTHLHTDHSADLPALLKSSYFSPRKNVLPIYGPSGADRWPALTEYVSGLLNSNTGIYRYLDDFVSDADGSYQIQSHDIDAKKKEPVQIINNPLYRVHAVGVHHGPVPALGLLVNTNEKSIAVSGDQSNNNPGFANMIKNADLLIMAHAIPETAGQVAKNLHATPRYIGMLAKQANIKTLVLSHLMDRSIKQIPHSIEYIKENYSGQIEIAEDLNCYNP